MQSTLLLAAVTLISLIDARNGGQVRQLTREQMEMFSKAAAKHGPGSDVRPPSNSPPKSTVEEGINAMFFKGFRGHIMNRCTKNKIACVSKRANKHTVCIDKNMLCNGIQECPSGEDETEMHCMITTMNGRETHGIRRKMSKLHREFLSYKDLFVENRRIRHKNRKLREQLLKNQQKEQ